MAEVAETPARGAADTAGLCSDMLGIIRSVRPPTIRNADPSAKTFFSTKSMKSGDKYRTNRMFRRRIYAQGFTILAMVAGSAYWESDRAKRKQYDGLVDEKKKKEKHEAWLRELEARDEEEQELRKLRDKIIAESGKKNRQNEVNSVIEECEERREGPVTMAARRLWESRR